MHGAQGPSRAVGRGGTGRLLLFEFNGKFLVGIDGDAADAGGFPGSHSAYDAIGFFVERGIDSLDDLEIHGIAFFGDAELQDYDTLDIVHEGGGRVLEIIFQVFVKRGHAAGIGRFLKERIHLFPGASIFVVKVGGGLFAIGENHLSRQFSRGFAFIKMNTAGYLPRRRIIHAVALAIVQESSANILVELTLPEV